MSYLKEMAEHGYHMGNIGPFHRHMVPYLLTSNGIGKNAVVVDIGAGQGHGLIPLHDLGWQHLIAVDLEDYNFNTFKTQYGFQTIQCDISKEPLNLSDNSVDAIISFHVIEHLPTPNQFLSECYRMLKIHGKLFIVTPDWRKQFKTFWRDPTHLRPFDKESMTRLLRMYGFQPQLYSWNARYGMGRLKAYRWFPKLGMIGEEMLAIGTKEAATPS